MVTRPEVVALAQNGRRLDHRDDGARRLGTPTALQLLSPLDDAMAIAACLPASDERRERKLENKWRLRGEQNLRLLLRAGAAGDEAGWGDIQNLPAIGCNIRVPALHWAT